jgi:hypothetical protein
VRIGLIGFRSEPLISNLAVDIAYQFIMYSI